MLQSLAITPGVGKTHLAVGLARASAHAGYRTYFTTAADLAARCHRAAIERRDAVLGDKAYSSRANRDLLRGRNIKAVIAEPADQASHRRRRGRAGGRPPAFDSETYKDRNVVERSFNNHKQWRGLATRYDRAPPSTAEAPCSGPS